MADNLKTEKNTLKLMVANLEPELGEEFTGILIELINRSKTKRSLDLAKTNYDVRLARVEISKKKREFMEKIKEALIKSLNALINKTA